MTSLRSVINEDFIKINADDIENFVMDGTYDNLNAIQNLQYDFPTKVVRTSTKLTVTLTMGSPGIVNLTNHLIRVGETVVFWGTGLPTGLIQGKIYWVPFEGMTQNSFRLTDTNMLKHFYLWDQYPLNFINFTGTQSGTVYMAIQNQGWNIVTWPPGTCISSASGNLYVGTSCRLREKHYGYGVESTALQVGGGGIGQVSYNWNDVGNCFLINNANRGDNKVQLKDSSGLSKLVPGTYICIMAGNDQDSYGAVQSWPPNTSNFEFKRINSIDAVNRYLYFADKTSGQPELLRNSYLDHYPIFGGWQPNYLGNSIEFPYGAACVTPMNSMWDHEHEYHGFRSTDLSGLGEFGLSGRRVRLVDYFFEGATGKPTPSGNKQCIVENCEGTTSQIDKMIESLIYSKCRFFSITSESAATDLYYIENSDITSVDGTGRNTLLINDNIPNLVIGPLGFGNAENLTLINCRVGQVQEANRLDQNPTVPSSYNSMIFTWTFSGGTLSQPLDATGANAWALPGTFCNLTYPAKSFGKSVACPFRILNIYTRATVRNITFNVGTSSVVDSTPPPIGTTVGFKLVSGVYPTGITSYTPFYVVSIGSGTYQVSTTKGGTPVTLGGTATGSYQSLISPQFCMDTTLDSLPNGDQVLSTVSINISTGVITWNGDGIGATPPNGTYIMFKTTGTLPTDATNGGTVKTYGGYYYVVSQSGNTFRFSTSPGGTPISLSGTQSGTQSVIGNPLMIKPITCPKITVIGCTGCPQIEDMSNGPPNSPLFSYTNRMFIGYIDAQVQYIPDLPQLAGKIVSMIVNVIRADVSMASLTVTLSIPSYNDDCTTAAPMSQVINLKVAGQRVITQTTISGQQTGDSIVAFPRWIAGNMSPQYSAYVTDTQLSQTAKWQLIVQTEQGMYNYPVVHYMPASGMPDGGMTLVGNNLSSTVPMAGNSPQ